MREMVGSGEMGKARAGSGEMGKARARARARVGMLAFGVGWSGGLTGEASRRRLGASGFGWMVVWWGGIGLEVGSSISVVVEDVVNEGSCRNWGSQPCFSYDLCAYRLYHSSTMYGVNDIPPRIILRWNPSILHITHITVVPTYPTF